MRSCWNSLYDRAKDRRYGMLFLLAPVAFFPVLCGFLADICHGFFHRPGQLNYSRLSSDERIKARSKLVKTRPPVKPPRLPPQWIEG
jgi:hypothetical protein